MKAAMWMTPRTLGVKPTKELPEKNKLTGLAVLSLTLWRNKLIFRLLWTTSWIFQSEIVRFYKVIFWDKVGGTRSMIRILPIQFFDLQWMQGVNQCWLAQTVVGSNCDGVIGPKTIKDINCFQPDHFIAAFTVEKCRKIHYYLQEKAG